MVESGLQDADLIHPARDQWPDLPDAFGALATTRRGGVSTGPYDDGQGGRHTGGGGLNLGLHVNDDPEAVQANRARLRARLPGPPAWIAQVHGADVGRPHAHGRREHRDGAGCRLRHPDG
jgi:copper oxidase (laccase) domain-containing protein